MRGTLDTSEETLAGAPFTMRGALKAQKDDLPRCLEELPKLFRSSAEALEALPKLCRSASRTLEPR
eukprot:168211-Pyramimonas_sp.AAC.1